MANEPRLISQRTVITHKRRQYKILRSTDPDELECEVNEHLSRGFKLCGEFIANPRTSEFMQAVIYGE